MGGNEVGRTRQAKNRKLEKYVKVLAKNGVNYYSVKHPKMPKAKSFAQDLDRANACAIAITAHYANAIDDITDILKSTSPAPSHSLAAVIDLFKDNYIKIQNWSDSYKYELFARLDKIRKRHGKTRFSTMGVKDVRTFIFDTFSGDGIRQAKQAMAHLYTYAIGEGLSDRSLINYAEKVNIPAKQSRQRSRISNYDEYLEAHSKAPEWLQDAMAISLLSLQSRAEICSMRIKDISGDTLKVARQKTGAHIEIEINDELRKVLNRCRVKAMAYGSPFIINNPSRLTNHGKEHRCQILPDYLSRAFSKISPTTFHEIRSLGVRIYQAMGMEKSWIQNLTGHGDEKMVELYAQGDEVQWIKAQATMEFSKIPGLNIKE